MSVAVELEVNSLSHDSGNRRKANADEFEEHLSHYYRNHEEEGEDEFVQPLNHDSGIVEGNEQGEEDPQIRNDHE